MNLCPRGKIYLVTYFKFGGYKYTQIHPLIYELSVIAEDTRFSIKNYKTIEEIRIGMKITFDHVLSYYIGNLTIYICLQIIPIKNM